MFKRIVKFKQKKKKVKIHLWIQKFKLLICSTIALASSIAVRNTEKIIDSTNQIKIVENGKHAEPSLSKPYASFIQLEDKCPACSYGCRRE